MGHELLIHLHRMNHDAVSHLDLRLLDGLLGAGVGGLRIEGDSTVFPAVVLTVTDVSETLATVPVTCSSPP
jgi:hypothetical protein